MKELHCPGCQTTFVPKWSPKPTKSGFHFCTKLCSIEYWAIHRPKSGPNASGICITCAKQTSARYQRCQECREARISEEVISKIREQNNTRIETQPRLKRRQKHCLTCLNFIGTSNTTGLCLPCFRDAEQLKTLDTPVKDFLYKNKGATNKYTRFREFSRRAAFRALDDLSCCICGYSTSIEVCHIKPVASFDEEALIREVNSLDNLTILCPNHHKEFDRKLTNIKPIPISQLLE